MTVSVVVGLVVVLLLIRGVAGMLADGRRSRMLDAWDGSLGSFEQIVERYPDCEANEAALRVEGLSAELGIDLTPRSIEDRVHPTREAVGRYQQAKLAINQFAEQQLEREGPRLEPPSAKVAEFFDAHRETVEEIRRQLAVDSAPRWARVLARPYRTPLPNLLGHINLQRLLMTDAILRADAGDSPGALITMEASWKLNSALRDLPFLVSQMIALDISRMQVGMLRQIERVPASWGDRLQAQDYRASISTALQVDGWNWMQMVDPGTRPTDDEASRSVLYAVVGPYVSFCTTDLSERWRRRLIELSELGSFCDRDLEALGITLSVEPAAWNLVARKTWFGDMDGVLRRLARYELDREMTSKLLELQRVREDSHGPWPASLPGIEQSPTCPEDHWIYEALPGGEVSLAFSRSVEWEGLHGAELPLRFVAQP